MSTLTAEPPNLLLRLWHLPHMPGLSAAVFMLGFGLSMAFPYLALFGVKVVHMTPLQLGVFLTLNAIGSVLISTRLARWSDRWPRRKPLVLAALAAGMIAYTLLSVVHSFPLILLIGMLGMGTASAAFPQLFAFSRVRFTGAPADLAERAVTVLRSVFSLAWVVGPGLGAVILARWGFQAVFLSTALCFVLAAVPLFGISERARALAAAQTGRVQEKPARSPVVVWVSLAFVLYGMSMSMGMSMFPLFITETLKGTEGQVGFLVSLCALLEIPAMLALVTLRNLPGTEKLVKSAFLLFVLHFVLTYLAHGTPLLVAGQVIRAGVLAVTAGLGMLYFQELMPGRFASATTLFSNTTAVGGMLAGIVSGACAQWFGYRAVFLLCAALTFIAWLVMQFIVKKRSGVSVQPSATDPAGV